MSGGKKRILESDLQGAFGKWIKYGGGASWTGNCCYHKISDSALGFKPFDCFVLGIEDSTVLGELGFGSAGIELKMSCMGSRIGFTEIKSHQSNYLAKSETEGSGGLYCFGYDVGGKKTEAVRCFILEVDSVVEYMEGKARGSFSVEWARDNCLYEVKGLKVK